MNKLEILIQTIKDKFADAPIPPAPPAAPAAPEAGNASNCAQYLVDGGAPVFVNVSDDGIAGIDKDDPVFTDAAMTIPYPDGSYKVTGTDFGFTVTGGKVSATDDKDGTGAGTPVQDSPKVDPAQMQKQFAVDLELLKTEFGTYKTNFAAIQTEFAAAKETIGKQDEAIKGLLQIVEQLSKVPTENPVEQPKNMFGKQSSELKEERLSSITNAIKDLKKK